MRATRADWKHATDKDHTQPKITGDNRPMVEPRGERVVMRPEDFTESEIEAMLNAPLHPDRYLYDDEME
jgi:hypothetical protein